MSSLSEKKLYTISQTIEVLAIGRTSLYDLFKRRELVPVKIGRRTLVPASEISALVSRLPTGTEAKQDRKTP